MAREVIGAGREYYKLRGDKLAMPGNALAIPSNDHLIYHIEHVFKG